MMSKISIVSLRRNRNKSIETPALLRAEQRTFAEQENGRHHSQALEASEKPQNYLSSEGSTAYQFDVVLSSEHLTKIMQQSLSLEQEDLTVDSMPAFQRSEKKPGHPVIFRFTVMPPKLHRTLTTEDVCNILRVSKRTLYRYVKKNKLNCVRINSQLRFLTEDIHKFLDENKS